MLLILTSGHHTEKVFVLMAVPQLAGGHCKEMLTAVRGPRHVEVSEHSQELFVGARTDLKPYGSMSVHLRQVLGAVGLEEERAIAT